MADALRQAAGHFRHGILAIGRDEIGKRREERRIGERLRRNAVIQRFLPGIEDVAERRLALDVALDRPALRKKCPVSGTFTWRTRLPANKVN